MKKIKRILIIFIFATIIISINTISKASSSGTGQSSGQNTTQENEVTMDSWVEEAFKAARNFLTDDEVTDDLGFAGELLILARSVINAINRVLIVLLAGISAIALSVVGIRYLYSTSKPSQVSKARDDLHTVFTGMLYGFGAYLIWRIAMSIVILIINNLA